MPVKAEPRKKASLPVAKPAAMQETGAYKEANPAFSQLQHGMGNRAVEELLNAQDVTEEPLEAADAGSVEAAATTKKPLPAEEALQKAQSDQKQEERPQPVKEPAQEAQLPGEMPDGPSPEATVDIAFPKAAAVEEKVEKVEALELKGSSDEAMGSFTGASASQIAASYPTLGTQLNKKLETEKDEEIKNAPVVTAKTEGRITQENQGNTEIKLPGEVKIEEGANGAEPPEVQAEEHKNFSEAPNNEAQTKSLEGQKSGGFLSWFKSFFNKFFNNIKTKDSGLNTGAGKRPNVDLTGQADPNRTDRQKSEADSAIKTQRDEASKAFATNPGQQNIQPKKIEQEMPLELNKEVSVTIEDGSDKGMEDYLDIALPKEVRAKADEMLKPALDKNLAAVNDKVKASVKTRDTDKKAEIKKNEEQTAKLNQQAQSDQENAVIQNRKKVAKEQQSGIDESHGLLKKFDTDAGSEQKQAKDAIKKESDKAHKDAKKELDKGESEAETLRKKGEEDARNKKKELEKKKKKKSWWDKAVDAVKSVVKAITKAIDKIFTAVRNAVKKAIDAARKLAVGLINAARKWIVDKLNKFRDWAKSQVNKYLKEHFPKLAARINKAIDTVVDTAVKVVNKVADGLIAGVNALAKALTAALDKILSVFQTALKAAVQIVGAVITGDFAEALKIAIQAACDIAGINSKPIFDFFERAGNQLMKILKKPAVFFGNLINAVSGGVQNFVKNIKKHLINGLIGWLTGALSEVEITLPEKFDVKGIFSLVMQILGLTYANIKARIIRRVPAAEKVFDTVEAGFAIIKEIALKGPIVLWEKVVESLSNLKEIVLSGIRNFVITTVVKEGITWLLGLLNPAAAIVKVLKLLFDFVMFLVERFNQIKDFVLSVYTSITAIAAGTLGPAMKAVENSLARILPVAISLLASLAGLGGIGKTVKNIIGKVSKPVNKVIDKIVDKVATYAEKLLGKGKGKGKGKKKKAKSKSAKTLKIDKDLGETIRFTAGKENHRLWIKKSGGKPEVMVASKPTTILGKLIEWKKAIGTLEKKDQAKAKTYISEATTLYKKTKGHAVTEDKAQSAALKDKKVTPAEKKKADKAERDTIKAQKELQKRMGRLFQLFDKEESGDLAKKYKSHIDQAHRSAKAAIKSEISAVKEAEAKKIQNWAGLKAHLQQRSKVKPLVEKPLSSTHKMGKDIINNEAARALGQAIKESPQTWEKYWKKKDPKNEKGVKKAFVPARVGVIHAQQGDLAKKAMANVQLFAFAQNKSGSVQGALKAYYAKSLEGGGTTEHTDYKPHVAEGGVKIADNRFTVAYTYENEQHKQKSFQVSFDFSKINQSNEVTQATKGKNLKLKPQGSRGKTASSGDLKDHSKAQKAGSADHRQMFKNEYLKKFIKEKHGNEHLQEKMQAGEELIKTLSISEKKEYEAAWPAEYKKVEHLKDEQQFDSAHILADWFGGSGYKEALNLVVTSAEYNRVVMGGAEKNIVKDVRAKNEESLFDLSVTATWDVLSDSEIKSQISAKTIQKQLPKNQGISEQGMSEIAKGSEADLYKILTSKQDPRRVLKVNYEGDIKVPQKGKLDEKIGCDIWMSNYFKFGKKEKCVM